MKINILLTFLLLFLTNIICSQTIDTLNIRINSNLSNSLLCIDPSSSYDNITLLEINKYFDGYLAIQLDSTSISDKYIPQFRTPIFWIESINSIQTDSEKVLFWYPDVETISENLKRKDLDNELISLFFKYYNIFFDVNLSNLKPFLYKFNFDEIKNIEIFNTENVFTSKDNNKTHYIFIKCSFNTAILRIENCIKRGYEVIGRKFINVFLPISYLKEFKVIKEINSNRFYKYGLIIKQTN